MSRPNANTPPRAAAARASAPPWRAGLLASALIAAIVLAVFAPVLGSRALSVDDDLYLSDNSLVNRPGIGTVAQYFREALDPRTVGGYWMPLSMTSLMLDAAQGATAEQPLPFHRTSLVLHVLATLALLWLLLLAFGAPLPAALAALVFGLHPLCVEPVAWIGERKTVLAGALALGSAALHVAWVRMGGSWRRAGAVALFALALLAKPTATPLPLLLLLLDLWPLRRFARAAVVEKWPYYVLAAASAAITLASHAHSSSLSGAAGGGAETLPLQLSARLCFYAGKVLWPANLACVYADAGPYAWTRPLLPLALVLVAAVLALAVLEARRRRPALLAGAGWFALALLPTLGVLHFSWVTLSDKYAYLALPGVALGLAGALAWALRRAGAVRVAAIAVVVAALGAEATVSRATIGHWSDTLTLWRHVVAVSPDAAGAHNAYGSALVHEHRGREALREFERASQLDPTFWPAFVSESYTRMQLGDVAGAERAIARARALRPREISVLAQSALVAEAAGQPAEVEQTLGDVLAVHPDDAFLRATFAQAIAQQGRIDEAIGELRRALASHPGQPQAELWLGHWLMIRQGFDAEARTHLDAALAASPGWLAAMNELAWGLATARDSTVRDAARALDLATRASALAGDSSAALLDTRAAAEASAGRYADATRTAARAIARAYAGRDEALASVITGHLAHYQQGRPWREPR